MLALMMMGSTSFAQKEAKIKKPNATQPESRQASSAANAPQQQAAQTKMKKDGTPDKRYKGNKQKKDAAKPAGPTKKDGTPDMRYKANKDAAKKK